METLIILMHPPVQVRSIDPPQPGMSFWTLQDREEQDGFRLHVFVLRVVAIDVSSHDGRVPLFVHLRRTEPKISETMYCQPTRKILLSSCKFLVVCMGSYFGIFYFCWSRLGCLSWWRLCHPHRSKLSTSALNHQ